MALHYNKKAISAAIKLPGSKSISNRLLILKEILNPELPLQNLSPSKDTRDLVLALEKIKAKKDRTIDIGHAGTDMRFLTALLSVKEGEWILTGSERMKQRPISELVDALKQIGAEIYYLENERFPPLKIIGKKLNGRKLEIDGSISSQFISALLLISPPLENGMEITIKNETVSWPYVEMTLDLLREFGIKVSTVLNTIIISPNPAAESQYAILRSQYLIESDWSSASYWYSIVALSKNAEIILEGLQEHSSQGDSVLPQIYKNFGVNTEFKNGKVLLTKSNLQTKNYFEYNFVDCPDLAQTVAVTCLGLKINCKLSGLSTLKHKETDRLQALKTEIEKFGAEVLITTDSLEIRNASLNTKRLSLNIHTYNDHRMAMSFAPLALIFDNIDIQSPEVVEKSYPEFWKDLRLVGVTNKGR